MTINMKLKVVAAFATLWMLMMGANMIMAQSELLGTWKTIDDDGETVKSLLEITKGDNGKLYGKVVKLFRKPDEDQDPHCTKCSKSDSRYNQRVLGMTILRDLKVKSDSKAEDGRILDPKNGKEYDCYIEIIEEGKLKVRGYIGLSIAGRTQYWYKQ